VERGGIEIAFRSYYSTILILSSSQSSQQYVEEKKHQKSNLILLRAKKKKKFQSFVSAAAAIPVSVGNSRCDHLEKKSVVVLNTAGVGVVAMELIRARLIGRV
jgi:hypothetical protein